MTIDACTAWASSPSSASPLYLLPTVVAVRRDAAATHRGRAAQRLLRLDGLRLGVGARARLRPRRPRPPLPPPPDHPAAAAAEDEVYRDGAYLLSRGPDTLHLGDLQAGRWTIVYEIDGADRLFGDVDARDIPFGVLAEAMLSTAPSDEAPLVAPTVAAFALIAIAIAGVVSSTKPRPPAEPMAPELRDAGSEARRHGYRLPRRPDARAAR